MKRLLILTILALAACKQEAAAPPPPATMTAEAVGHFCQMDLLEHPGPKAQVHLDGMPYPLFFSQVRDAEAYRRMPEQSHAIRAIYVSDMAAAPSWDDPGADNWIAAGSAIYVVGAEIVGGMGAQEFVPFSDRAAARDFIDRHGGELMELADIPDDLVFAPENAPENTPSGNDDSNYLERLRAITNTSGG